MTAQSLPSMFTRIRQSPLCPGLTMQFLGQSSHCTVLKARTLFAGLLTPTLYAFAAATDRILPRSAPSAAAFARQPKGPRNSFEISAYDKFLVTNVFHLGLTRMNRCAAYRPPCFTAASAWRAARRNASMSAAVCAAETKPTSNCEGGR